MGISFSSYESSLDDSTFRPSPLIILKSIYLSLESLLELLDESPLSRCANCTQPSTSSFIVGLNGYSLLGESPMFKTMSFNITVSGSTDDGK